jgi:hypothetical protein
LNVGKPYQEQQPAHALEAAAAGDVVAADDAAADDAAGDAGMQA